MSKSKGNVLYADDLVDVFGVDAVRYFVLSGMPFDNDGLVGWNIMTEKINTELANVYGNLVKRTISMTNKYFDGVIPAPTASEELDNDLISVLNSYNIKSKTAAHIKLKNTLTYHLIGHMKL